MQAVQLVAAALRSSQASKNLGGEREREGGGGAVFVQGPGPEPPLDPASAIHPISWLQRNLRTVELRVQKKLQMLAYHSKHRSGASSAKFLPALHTKVAWQVAADMKQTSNRQLHANIMTTNHRFRKLPMGFIFTVIVNTIGCIINIIIFFFATLISGQDTRPDAWR